MTHVPLYHGCITSSYIAREVGIDREDGAMRDEVVKMNETEQGKDARGRHPNTAKCTERCRDGAQDGLLRATNHTLHP